MTSTGLGYGVKETHPWLLIVFHLSQTLNNILPILKSKGAAIAFETVGGRVHYIYELPAIVNSRLTKFVVSL